MIRTASELAQSKRRLEEERRRLRDHEKRLRQMGLSGTELKRALDPLRTFQLQLEEEVAEYERLRRGDIGELVNLHGLGRTLVALRAALGLTQKELAERLGVHESQVCRDERNEYRGLTVERASRVLDALGVRLTSALGKANGNTSVRTRRRREQRDADATAPRSSTDAVRGQPVEESAGG
jgi:transcriptional regulator with XRE-family HTH domain